MDSKQMRLEAETAVRSAVEAVQSANLNPEAQYAVLVAILTAEMSALLERVAREALEQYVLPAMAIGGESELSSEEATTPTTPLPLRNERGESPRLNIGTDAAGGFVFSSPQG